MSKQHNSKVADGSGLVAVVSPQNANKSNDLCENKDPQKSNMVVTLYDLGLRSRDDVKQLIETGLFPDQLLAIKNDITVHRLNLPKFSRRYRTNELSRKDQLSNIIDGELNGFTVVQGVAYTTSSKAQSSTQLKKRRAKLTKANFAFGLDGLPIQQHGNMTVIQQGTNPVDQSLCSDSACVEEEAPVAPVVGDSKTADNISVVCESSAPSERSDLDAICDLIDKLEKSDLAIVYRYAQRKYDQTPGTPVAPAKKSRRKKKKQTVVTPVLSEVEYPALPKVDLPVEIPAEFTEVLDLPKKKKRKQRKARIPLFEVAVDASVEIEQHGNVVSKEDNVSQNIAAPASPTKKKKVVYKPFVDQSSPDKPTFDFVLPAKVKQGSSVHQCPIAKYPLHLWKRALNASPSLSIEEVAEKEFKRMVKSSLIHWTLQWKRSSTDRNPWLADWNATIRQLMKYDMKEWYNAYQAFKDRATSFTEKNSNPQWAIEPKQN